MTKKMIDCHKEKIIIYNETTLDEKTILSIFPHATIHRAIEAGDLLLAIQKSYTLAIIIDGHFDFTRPIWHKEILWAIKQGLCVIGCASMGALRAAESDQFGMIGSGYVYDLYKQNITDDDSEIALHYYKLNDKLIATVPLVNLRYTLTSLKDQNLINQEKLNHIFSLSKHIFYKKRSWQNLQKNLSKDDFQLIKNHYFDIKAKDALDCLYNLNTLVTKKININELNIPKTIFLKRLINQINNDDQLDINKIFNQFKKHKKNDTIQTDKNTKNTLQRSMELQKLTGLNQSLNQSAITFLNQYQLDLTDYGFKQNLAHFRLMNGLENGMTFKAWCEAKALDFQVIEQTFKDFFILKRFNQ